MYLDSWRIKWFLRLCEQIKIFWSKVSKQTASERIHSISVYFDFDLDAMVISTAFVEGKNLITLSCFFPCSPYRRNKMNRPNGQQCVAKAIIDHTNLWWFNTNAYSNETGILWLHGLTYSPQMAHRDSQSNSERSRSIIITSWIHHGHHRQHQHKCDQQLNTKCLLWNISRKRWCPYISLLADLKSNLIKDTSYDLVCEVPKDVGYYTFLSPNHNFALHCLINYGQIYPNTVAHPYLLSTCQWYILITNVAYNASHL